MTGTWTQNPFLESRGYEQQMTTMQYGDQEVWSRWFGSRQVEVRLGLWGYTITVSNGSSTSVANWLTVVDTSMPHHILMIIPPFESNLEKAERIAELLDRCPKSKDDKVK